MKTSFNNAHNRGSSFIEYAFIAALVAGVGLTGSAFLGGEVNTLLSRLSNVMTTGQETSADNLGDHTATQSLNMSGFSIIGLASPTNDTDAATKAYVDTAVAGTSGADNLGDHTATQILNMGTFRIASVGTPTDAADAATKGYVDSAIAGIPGGDNLGNHTATQNLALGSNWISNDGSSIGISVGSGGNVGIGTVPSASKLTVSGTTTEDGLRVELDDSNNVLLAFATGILSHNLYTSGNNGNFALHTAGSEAIRLSAGASSFITSGRLGLGTTAPNYLLHLNASGAGNSQLVVGNRTASLDGGDGVYIEDRGRFFLNYSADTAGTEVMVLTRQNATTGTTKPIEFRRDGANVVGNITMTNSSVSYNTTSDHRLKKDVKPIENALESVRSLRPSSFRFIVDDKAMDGFLAHEVQEVAPYAVIGQKDAVDQDGEPIYQTLDYGKLTPLLTAAIQELEAKTTKLEQELQYWKTITLVFIALNLMLATSLASRIVIRKGKRQ